VKRVVMWAESMVARKAAWKAQLKAGKLGYHSVAVKAVSKVDQRVATMAVMLAASKADCLAALRAS